MLVGYENKDKELGGHKNWNKRSNTQSMQKKYCFILRTWM